MVMQVGVAMARIVGPPHLHPRDAIPAVDLLLDEEMMTAEGMLINTHVLVIYLSSMLQG